MRHLLLIFLTSLFITNMQAQDLHTDTLPVLKSYNYYRQKRNTYNTIGWLCLGTGSLMAVSGFVVNVGETFNHGTTSKGDGIAIAGELIALASIPFFISAHHNKKKASLYLNKGAVTINDRPLYHTSYTSLTLAIKL